MKRAVKWVAMVLGLLGGLLGGLAGCGRQVMVTNEPAPVHRHLNVVLILADDLGIGDLGVYNPDSKIPTPNLDRLAATGMRFTDAHSPSAVCTPTRYGILTGRYAWRTRMKAWVLNGYSRALVEPGRETIASLLNGEMYFTAAVGKWHLGLGAYDAAEPGLKTDYLGLIDAGPHTTGFDRSAIIPASLDMPPYVWLVDGEVGDTDLVDDPGSRRRWDGGGGFWRGGDRSRSFDMHGALPETGRRAVEYLGESAVSDERFFVYVPLSAPHTPWMPTEEFQGATDAGWYGDFVMQVDHTVGEILGELDRLGLDENTIVIFTSDNGSHWRERDEQEFDHLANLNYRGMKADIHESGHRVPLIVRWPGVTDAGSRAGLVSDATVGLHDLYATLAQGMGLELSVGEAPDSESFFAALRGEAFVRPEPVVHHSGAGHFAIRDGDWKLIERLGSGGFTNPKDPEPVEGGPRGQLYNLADDPGERTNLWLERPEIVERLTAHLDRIRASE